MSIQKQINKPKMQLRKTNLNHIEFLSKSIDASLNLNSQEKQTLNPLNITKDV